MSKDLPTSHIISHIVPIIGESHLPCFKDNVLRSVKYVTHPQARIGRNVFHIPVAAIQKVVSAGKLPVMVEVHVYSGRLIDCNAIMCKREE